LQDWVVGKYGRALPVVHLRRKDKRKVNISVIKASALRYSVILLLYFISSMAPFCLELHSILIISVALL